MLRGRAKGGRRAWALPMRSASAAREARLQAPLSRPESRLRQQDEKTGAFAPVFLSRAWLDATTVGSKPQLALPCASR